MSYDRQAAFWSVQPRGELQEVRRTAVPSIVWPRSCAFLGGKRLVTASFGSTYASFDFASGKWECRRIEPANSLNAVRIVANSIYSVGDAGVVLRDGEPLASIGSLCNFLLPVGGLVLTGGQMGQLFDAATGRLIYQHRSPLNCGAAFMRHGRQHAIVGTYTGEGLVFREADNTLEHVATIALNDNAIKGVGMLERSHFRGLRQRLCELARGG